MCWACNGAFRTPKPAPGIRMAACRACHGKHQLVLSAAPVPAALRPDSAAGVPDAVLGCASAPAGAALRLADATELASWAYAAVAARAVAGSPAAGWLSGAAAGGSLSA